MKALWQKMKRILLTMLVCAFLPPSVAARPNSDKQSAANQQEEAQKSEAQSPELVEAQKLSVEAVKLYKAGKLDEATVLAKRALQLRDKALAPGHDLIQSSLINLGEIYRARRKYGEAKVYFERLLTIYDQAPAPAPAAVASVLDILAQLNYLELDYDEAEKLYQRSLALREQGGGPENLEVANSLFNLAEFYRLRGDFTKAEPFYQRAVEIRGRALGPDDKDVVKALERYACLYYSTNQQEKVKEIGKQFSFLRERDAALFENGEILNGKILSLDIPDFPRVATGRRRRRLSGTIVLKVSIDEKGKVIKAEDMCAAHPLFVGAAIREAYQERFVPAVRSGVSVQVTGVIAYRFVAK